MQNLLITYRDCFPLLKCYLHFLYTLEWNHIPLEDPLAFVSKYNIVYELVQMKGVGIMTEGSKAHCTAWYLFGGEICKYLLHDYFKISYFKSECVDLQIWCQLAFGQRHLLENFVTESIHRKYSQRHLFENFVTESIHFPCKYKEQLAYIVKGKQTNMTNKQHVLMAV